MDWWLVFKWKGLGTLTGCVENNFQNNSDKIPCRQLLCDIKAYALTIAENIQINSQFPIRLKYGFLYKKQAEHHCKTGTFSQAYQPKTPKCGRSSEWRNKDKLILGTPADTWRATTPIEQRTLTVSGKIRIFAQFLLISLKKEKERCSWSSLASSTRRFISNTDFQNSVRNPSTYSSYFTVFLLYIFISVF